MEDAEGLARGLAAPHLEGERGRSVLRQPADVFGPSFQNMRWELSFHTVVVAQLDLGIKHQHAGGQPALERLIIGQQLIDDDGLDEQQGRERRSEV